MKYKTIINIIFYRQENFFSSSIENLLMNLNIFFRILILGHSFSDNTKPPISTTKRVSNHHVKPCECAYLRYNNNLIEIYYSYRTCC